MAHLKWLVQKAISEMWKYACTCIPKLMTERRKPSATSISIAKSKNIIMPYKENGQCRK